jgi:uncharacterized protein (TIGR00296 family)
MSEINILNKEEQQLLLKIARDNIDAFLVCDDYEVPDNLPAIFHENLGVFVTLNKNNALRGCIGYPNPIKPLIEAVLDVSVSAAVSDPRFASVVPDEMEDIQLEISVLSKPKLVEVNDYMEYLSKLTVGVDGLVMEKGYHSGLLLPQVPIEQEWDIQEFLENLCYKAGLPYGSWKDKDTKIYNFQAQVFHE